MSRNPTSCRPSPRRWAGAWLAAAAFAAAMPAGDASAIQRPYDLPPEQLAPGDYLWMPEAAPAGPLLLVVSIPEQRAYLYRNGLRIAVSTVSTGREGNETPPGVYTILQKRREHYSNLYDDAPMPFMQRLTWGGVALHAGRLPGYPASHGCVRLPAEFAERLFGVSELGMTVVVADDPAGIPGTAHPGWLAPEVEIVAEAAGAPRADGVADPAQEALSMPPVALAEETFFWEPERSPAGPMTVLLSLADRRIRVLRNGIEIGRSAFSLDGPVPAGTRVLQLQSGTQPGENRHVPGQPRLNWTRLDSDAGAAADHAVSAEPQTYDALRLPPGFVRQVYAELRPGTTVVLTDLPELPGAPALPILETDSAPDPR